MQKLVVEAGGHASLPALVRNQSGIVDNYELQVKGMPEEWWNVTPPSVYLVPFGAPSGTYEQEVTLHFNPPRSAEAEAKVWELEVVAVSRAQDEVAGTTKAWVEITPYEQLESELRPEIVTGRRRGEFALMVRNRANAPIDTDGDGGRQRERARVQSSRSSASSPSPGGATARPSRPRRSSTTGSAARSTAGSRSARTASPATTASTRPITGTFRQKPLAPVLGADRHPGADRRRRS